MRNLFTRNAPLPLISRWYSVESAAHYVFALFSVGILSNYVGSCHLLFWPGDSPDQPQTEPEEYRNLCLKRSEMLKNFVRSEEMRTALVVSNVSSLPRWHYARCLTITKDELNPLPEPGSGAYLGLRGIFSDTSKILSGKNLYAESTIYSHPRPAFARLHCWRALIRSLLYLVEKNMPYTGTVWNIIRGVIPPERVVDIMKTSPCCEDSGLGGKIRSVLGRLVGNEYEETLKSLLTALREIQRKYCDKGNDTNVETESEFRVCTGLSLKQPYKPVLKRTLKREHTLRWRNLEHRRWYEKVVFDVFG